MTETERQNLTKSDLSWCLNILRRLKETLESDTMEEWQKIHSAKWLVKQGLKGHENGE